MAKQPELLTPNDITILYGVPPATVRHHIRKGWLPARQISGVWVILPADLKAHAAKVGWEKR